MEFKSEPRLPTVEEYNYLRSLAEWPTFENGLAEKGLANSLFSVCISTDTNQLVGFGRVIGDGAMYFHIQDVIVHPEYQRRGIGKMIMKELLLFTEQTGGKNTNIGLMCSKGREKFYSELGFTVRPNEKFGAGMIRIKT
jgi:ribosomal protein S18 acetylase RimI-like enzyme